MAGRSIRSWNWPCAEHRYHAVCSKLERSPRVKPKNDLGCDLLRLINDEPAARQCGNKLAYAYLLTPRGASAIADNRHNA